MVAAYVIWTAAIWALHRCGSSLASNADERRQVLDAIGPLWTWHEVWLVAAGGVLLLAFPAVLATAFAGYYLALFLVIWLLIARGVSMEVGGHVAHPLWQAFWDFVLTSSSALLATLLGLAFGNIIRGVPLDFERRIPHGVLHRLHRRRTSRSDRLVYALRRRTLARNARRARGNRT